MELMTVAEAAKLWGLTKRRVQAMCETGQIKNAQRLGNMWVFSKSTEKPLDGRTKTARKEKTTLERGGIDNGKKRS